jgi:hypothetical protein
MRNALGRLKEEFPENHYIIPYELTDAIIKDDVGLINRRVAQYFATPETAPLLNGAITFLVEDDEINDVFPPAVLAVKLGKRDALRAILKITGNPNVRENPDTPEYSPPLLVTAVIKGDIEMIRMILEAGANPNDEYSGIGDDGEVRYTSDALSAAISLGLQKTAALLLEYGAASSNAAGGAIDYDENPALHLAQIISSRPELLETPVFRTVRLLHCAVAYGKLAHVKWLVEQGAEINPLCDAETPLDMALSKGHDDVALYLKSVGGKFGQEVGDPELVSVSPLPKSEITNLIERLELLEEKFGIALSGIYATCEPRTWATPVEYGVTINCDVSSSSGGELARNFNVRVSAYNAAGQMIGTTSSYISKDNFVGFESISMTLYLDQPPEKVRLFPAT